MNNRQDQDVRRICVVTGSRAEYGLLYWVMKAIEDEPSLRLQTAATGMHLSEKFGYTCREIEADGFHIDSKVDIRISEDTPEEVTKSLARGVAGFADAYQTLEPDIVLLLGDRFEIFAAAQAALIAQIPVAHIAGGDVTEGAYDEAMRHSITKMSHIHFVTCEDSANRVRQLGENPKSIFVTGNPGLDHLDNTALLDIPDLQNSMDFQFRDRNVLVTYHPVTLEAGQPDRSFRNLLTALMKIEKDSGIILTRPNADPNNQVINSMIDAFVDEHAYAKAYTSLGSQRYLSVLSHVDVVVGNSSSGLYEAPSFGTPTVNLGDRQKGRVSASSVIDCAEDEGSISNAILQARQMDCSQTVNPYYVRHSSKEIVQVLARLDDPKSLIKKKFFDIEIP